METWRDILLSAAAHDKRIVIRKVLLTKQGIPYANKRHELLYIASDACIGVQRAQGVEMPGDCLGLMGRPQTLKFVTKEEKNTHNNLTNNKGDQWEIVHYDGTQAVIVTPVTDELQGAASWQELAAMAGASIETIEQIRRTCVRERTRPIPFYFGGQSDKVSTVQSKRTSHAEAIPAVSEKAAPLAVPANPIPTAPEQPAVVAMPEPVAHSSNTEADQATATGKPEKTVLTDLNTSDDRRALRTLNALREEAEQSAEGRLPEGITARAYLADKVQSMGKLQAEIETLRESMMNHIIQIGDGAPPIIPIAKPVVCASLFRVADPALIQDLNMIMFDCAKRCSEALVYAEERALGALSAEADDMLRDWEPTAQEAAAIHAIKRARRDRTKVKAPRPRRDKIAFYRLPEEGDHAIPSLDAHTVNESGHKIPAKKPAAVTKGSPQTTDVTAAPSDPAKPARKRGPKGPAKKKGAKNPKPQGEGQQRAGVPKPAQAAQLPPKNPPAPQGGPKGAAKPVPGKSNAPGQKNLLPPRGGQTRAVQPNVRKGNAPPQRQAPKNFSVAPRRPQPHADEYQWQHVSRRRQRPPQHYGPQGHFYQPRQQYHGQYHEGQRWQQDAPYYPRNY